MGVIMNEFKKKMYEKIKTYSNQKYLEGYIKDEYLTQDGDADLYLNLKSIDDLVDSRTIGNQLDVVKKVYKFIEDKSAMLDNDTQLELHIKGIEVDTKTQGSVKHIIKEHYAIELYKIQKKYLRARNKIIGLSIFGIISFILYTAIFLYNDSNFLLEVFGFLFTFSLWEAFDAYIYNLSDIKFERENITQNLLMKVSFDDSKEEQEDII